MAYPIIDALTGEYIGLNGIICRSDSEAAKKLQEPFEGKMFYEVIRIKQMIPLFWEDHINRLESSIAGRMKLPESLRSDCLELIHQNGRAVGAADPSNLRIVVSDQMTVIHLAPPYYPDSMQMKQGVPVLILNWERENPNVKMIRSDYKEAVAAGFQRLGRYGKPFELLLADRSGYLTEGSRSNLFFIRDHNVYSAPDARILLGITRKHVLNALEQAGAQLVEKMFTLEELRTDPPAAAFLSGSPIDLLPISAIEDVSFASASNPEFMRIHEAYQKILNQYIEERK